MPYKPKVTQKSLTMVENKGLVDTCGEDSHCLNGSEVIEYIRKVATESVQPQTPIEKHLQSDE